MHIIKTTDSLVHAREALNFTQHTLLSENKIYFIYMLRV